MKQEADTTRQRGGDTCVMCWVLVSNASVGKCVPLETDNAPYEWQWPVVSVKCTREQDNRSPSRSHRPVEVFITPASTLGSMPSF